MCWEIVCSIVADADFYTESSVLSTFPLSIGDWEQPIAHDRDFLESRFFGAANAVIHLLKRQSEATDGVIQEMLGKVLLSITTFLSHTFWRNETMRRCGMLETLCYQCQDPPEELDTNHPAFLPTLVQLSGTMDRTVSLAMVDILHALEEAYEVIRQGIFMEGSSSGAPDLWSHYLESLRLAIATIKTNLCSNLHTMEPQPEIHATTPDPAGDDNTQVPAGAASTCCYT